MHGGNIMNILIYSLIAVCFLIVVTIKDSRERKIKIHKRLIDEFNNELDRTIDIKAFEALKAFDTLTAEQNELHIDEDTWIDLNMDDVFDQINSTNSSVGREYLYYMLHNPQKNMDELEEINRLCTEFTNNEKDRITLQEKFLTMGYAGISDVYSNILEIISLDSKSNIKHYVANVVLVISIVIMLAYRADIGTFIFVGVLVYNIVSYFKEKAELEKYLSCIKCVVRMVSAAKDIVKADINFIRDYNSKLRDNLKKTGGITNGFYMITSGNGYSGSLSDVILDYIRMIFHIDLIRFNQLTVSVKKYSKEVIDMYETLGYLESCIAIASYRNKLACWCIPNLRKGNEYKVQNVYHPLLNNPVKNSITASECVLLTGSNASGKSTFLRAIAINALLSETIATSVSDNYEGDIYNIVSSMTHRDDIITGDSYYMVEIKALKRILDLNNTSKYKVLCFLDEVLRGTNTVERIAASTQILKSFAINNALCFAATHDIELTSLLKEFYRNYHFDESFANNDVKYNYTLLDGPAETRNAIKLLHQNGYDKAIVDDAINMTKIFENQGIWKI